MTIKKSSLLLALVGSIFFCAHSFPEEKCEKENGDIIRKEISLAAFSKLTITGSSNIYLSSGDTQKVEIETTENIIPLLNNKVDNELWVLSFSKCLKTKKPVNFYITMNNIEALDIEGSGDLYGKNELKSDELEIKVIGSGDVEAKIKVKELKTEIQGSGSISLEGESKNQTVSISGSGNYKSYDLKSKNTSLLIDGSGDAKVYAKKLLEVTLSGSGDASYDGKPEEANIKITGSGEIKAR